MASRCWDRIFFILSILFEKMSYPLALLFPALSQYFYKGNYQGLVVAPEIYLLPFQFTNFQLSEWNNSSSFH